MRSSRSGSGESCSVSTDLPTAGRVPDVARPARRATFQSERRAAGRAAQEEGTAHGGRRAAGGVRKLPPAACGIRTEVLALVRSKQEVEIDLGPGRRPCVVFVELAKAGRL